MSLSDPKYLLLLAGVCAVFYLLPAGRLRAALLLIVSYAFYFNLSGVYVLILAAVTAIAYFGAILIASQKGREEKWRVFSTCCAIVLTPLIILKYSNFLLSIGVAVITPDSPPILVNLLLPIGLSFFTFVALGYVIDVYLGVVDPERRPMEFALFLSFFPLVTAGPIERSSRFLPQFGFNATFKRERAFAALQLIFVGLFLKVCLANSLVSPINEVLSAPNRFIPLESVFASEYYMFYIYADFAGYSLIAIGSAKLLGLEVRPNFRYPYLSTSVPEFWRNWHISLSSWVRDYLFMPMRMNWRHYPILGMAAALMLSFLIIGVWHGAGWNFVVFGLMHGIFAVSSTFTLKYRDLIWAQLHIPPAIVRLWRIIYTDILVMLAFVVYRAATVGEALPIYRRILRLGTFRDIYYGWWHLITFGNFTDLQVIKLTSWTWLIPITILVGQIMERRKITIDRFPLVLQIMIYNIGLGLIIYAWVASSAFPPFIYYRF
jgi:alginate O-acetyltransferase complex protein AlgI